MNEVIKKLLEKLRKADNREYAEPQTPQFSNIPEIKIPEVEEPSLPPSPLKVEMPTIEPLTKLKVTGAKPTKPIEKPDFIKEIGKALIRGSEEIGASVGRVMRWSGQKLERESKSLLPYPFSKLPEEHQKRVSQYMPSAKVSPTILPSIAGIQPKFLRDWELALKGELGQEYEKLGVKVRDYFTDIQKEGIEAIHPELMEGGAFYEGPQGFLVRVIESMPAMGAAVAVSVVTKNPVIGAGMLGLMEGSALKEAAEEGGVDFAKANFIGNLSAVGTTLLEIWPMAQITKGLVGRTAIRRIGVSMLAEGGEEGLQQIWNNALAIWGWDKSRSYVSGVIESILAGALLGGFFSGFFNVANPIHRHFKARENEALEGGMTPNQLNAIKEQIASLMIDAKGKVEKVWEEFIVKPSKLYGREAGFTTVFTGGEPSITPKVQKMTDIATKIIDAADNNNIPIKVLQVNATPLSPKANLDDLILFAEKKGLTPAESDEFFKLVNTGEIYTNAQDFGGEKGKNIKKIKNAYIDFYNQTIQAEPKAEPKVELPEITIPKEEVLTPKEQAEVKESVEAEEPTTRPPSLIELGVQHPKAPKITRTEDMLLKKKLRDETRGSKYGYKAGSQEMRTNIISGLRIKEANIKDIKQQLIDYTKLNVPTPFRGKFIVTINNAKTQSNLIKAFSKVDAEVERIAREQTIGILKKKINKIADSKSVAIEYKNRIKELVSDIEIPRHQKKTIAKLKKIENYIKEQERAGREVEMPKRILDALQILKRKPITEFSTDEIQALVDKISILEEVGRMKLTTRQEIDALEKDLMLSELVEGTHAIEKNKLLQPKIGERLDFNERFRNIFPRLLNGLQHIDLAITPMDAIFDMQDGNVGYTGPNYRFFKKKLDLKFSSFLKRYVKNRDEIWTKADALNLDTENFDRIGVHAALMQENGRDKLLNSGHTEEEIDSIKLTKNELELYDLMRKRLDEIKPEIAEIMRVVYNEPLGDVKNYFSFMTDFNAMDESEVYQRIGSTAEEFGMSTKNVERRFTKERMPVAGAQPIKINAMEIYTRHMENAAYLIEMAKDIKQLYELANSPAYGEVAGDRGQKIVLEWLDLMARKGGAVGASQMATSNVIRRNIGIAVLGFKLSSALIQPTALLDGAAKIGNYAFRGANNVLKPGELGAEWRDFLYENLAELKERAADDPAFREFAKNRTLANIQEKGFIPLKYLDAITASAIASGAYLKYLDEHNIPLDLNKPVPEAIDYAQLIVRRTQASSFFKDVPLAISKGGLTGHIWLDKAIFQFQNFMLGRWSLIRHDFYELGIREKNYKDAARVLFWIMMANISAVGIRRLSKEALNLLTGYDDPYDDGFVADAIEEIVTMVPFVSQYISVATYGGEPIPVLDTLRVILEEPKKIREVKTARAKKNHITKLADALARAMGIPGSAQASQIVRKLIYGGGPEFSRTLDLFKKAPEEGTLNFEDLDFDDIDLDLKDIDIGSMDFSHIEF